MMRSIRKIIVTGDVLRVNHAGRESQNGNIRWLYYLIRPALEMCSPLPVEPLYHMGGPRCLAQAIYRANRLPTALDGWVELYGKHPAARDMALLHERLEDTFVIAFEMPEFVRYALDELAIPYVDITIHPVRFMDDLLFGVRSNIAGLSEVLQPWSVPDAEIRIAAGLAMSTLARLPPIPECKDVGNVGLFCGQTADDKVLIRNGHLLGPEDFMRDFSEMCVRHERILVKPHPHAKDNPMVLALTRLFENTVQVDANFYHLLAQESVSHVYSVTSSTSIEAAYLGKHGVHFSRYPYAFSDTSALGGHYMSIRPEIYMPGFWQAILKKLDCSVQDVPSLKISESRNRMRRSLRSLWGADIFEIN